MNSNLDTLRMVCVDQVENLARHLLPQGKRAGRYWQAGSIQGEAGQSLKVILQGDRQGTWKDFESGEGGDLIALWQIVYQCSFAEALNQMSSFLGIVAHKNYPSIKPKVAPPTIITKPKEINPQILSHFYDLCIQVEPMAFVHGTHYLHNRGILPHIWDRGVLILRQATLLRLTQEMQKSIYLQDFLACGLLKEKDGKVALQWWDDVALFFCYDLLGKPNYVLGRRLNWTKSDRVGKWINLKGSPTIYGLPSLWAASDAHSVDWWPTQNKSELLIVEGPADVLAAHCLGYNAIGMLGKIQSNDLLGVGKAHHLFSPYLDQLRKIKSIIILPDDDGPEKEAENHKQALSLADWFWIRHIQTEVKTLKQFLGDDAKNHKDLADVAKEVFI